MRWILQARAADLSLEDRILLVAVSCRTKLTMRQLAPLFGVSSAAAHRITDRHSPLLALARTRRHPKIDEVVIADGTLVPTHDRSVAALSKHCQHSANPQILIDARTRLQVEDDFGGRFAAADEDGAGLGRFEGWGGVGDVA